MIRTDQITKRFGRITAVDRVTFTQDAGSALALWGSNGAGKTTLIRCILGVARCAGRATIAGFDVRTRGRHARACVGYVPQELSFHDDARVASAMAFFSDLRRVPRSRAGDALDAVGLIGQDRKRVRDLSGGMKQRLALAIAMLADPPIIILDEPTSNLDASGRGEVAQMLRDLKQRGKTLLFASHRPDEIIALADRVLVLEKGKIERDTTPAELWPSERAVRVMRLFLASGSEAEAANALREAGHAVHLNGHGLCVAVSRDRKGEPIAALARRHIDVRDMELIEDIEIPGDTP